MKDIVIYTNPDTLAHKRGVNEPDLYYYWTLKRPPKSFDGGCLIYFAVKGFVIGSFICDCFDPYDEKETIVWNKNSWNVLEEPIPTKSFRGFRYKWW